ncbi:hypothetical protein B0H63DRAFT_98338 [Podospora didyma]|uniref:Uncharacterized protein n=1 Tax=Podospora didyma TaxID=330526 RepID=A0AAE0NXE5_9PEZI|nr:hypothetical protein B0H63DRAFT_98338 [Podospora didyma]
MWSMMVEHKIVLPAPGMPWSQSDSPGFSFQARNCSEPKNHLDMLGSCLPHAALWFCSGSLVLNHERTAVYLDSDFKPSSLWDCWSSTQAWYAEKTSCRVAFSFPISPNFFRIALNSNGHRSFVLIPGLARGCSSWLRSFSEASHDLKAAMQIVETGHLSLPAPSPSERASRVDSDVSDDGMMSRSSSIVASRPSTSVMRRAISSFASLRLVRIR